VRELQNNIEFNATKSSLYADTVLFGLLLKTGDSTVDYQLGVKNAFNM
jgi:hypothetical protein